MATKLTTVDLPSSAHMYQPELTPDRGCFPGALALAVQVRGGETTEATELASAIVDEFLVISILERDPYTGQLYQLSPYGYSPYGAYGYDNYPYGYNRGYYGRGGGGYSTRPSQPKPQKPTPNRQSFEDARSKVLGGKKQ